MKVVISILLCLFSISFNAHAQDALRIDDVRLQHPFKSGVLKGASFGLYTFDREEVTLITPNDAQLPAGFEQYVRRHGAFAYSIGLISGFLWSFLVVGFFLYGTLLRFRAPQATPVGKEA